MTSLAEWQIYLQTLGDFWVACAFTTIVFFIIAQIQEQRGDK